VRVCLLLFVAASAWACDCGAWPSAKGAWETSPVVFLGHVERTEQEFDKLAPPLRDHLQYRGRQTAWVKVDEAFKGVQVGAELRLEQPAHNCAPKFRAGERVTFYLHPAKEQGAWEAYGCHRTREATLSADDLLFLRALPSSSRRSRLSGEVELYENAMEEPFRRMRGLSGIPVRIQGDGRLIKAITNADGVYEVYDLPEGVYRVDVDLPEGLEIHFPILAGVTSPSGRYKSTEVSLASGAGGSVSFVVMENNVVSGQLVDPEGKPLARIPVALEPVGGLAPSSRPPQSYTKEDGRFELTKFPSGDYLLVANLSGSASGRIPFGAVYFPGVGPRQQAQVFSIRAGSPITNLTLRIPKLEPTITVSGHVRFRDGKPVSKPNLILLDGDKREDLYPAGDLEGRFQIQLLAGKPVRLQASWMAFVSEREQNCPDLPKLRPNRYSTELKSEPLLIAAETSQTGLVLTVPDLPCPAP
jgi:hypothetical protein